MWGARIAIFCGLLLTLLSTGNVLGGDPTQSRIVTPPPQSNLRSATDRPVPGPSAWQRIEDPIDRSTGRIVDEQLYETSRLHRFQDERVGRIQPQTDFQQFQDERERRLRLEKRVQDQQEFQRRTAEQQRQAEIERRMRDLINQPYSAPMSEQAAVDRGALLEARRVRDEQTAIADRARNEALRDPQADRQQVERNYEQALQRITEQYDRTRSRILGMDPVPATQPSGQ